MGKAELRFDTDADRQEGRRLLDLVGSPGAPKLTERQLELAKRAWAEENAEAIKAHEAFIETYGAFGDDLRTW